MTLRLYTVEPVDKPPFPIKAPDDETAMSDAKTPGGPPFRLRDDRGRVVFTRE
jgi:hypothetical protein